MSLLACVVRVFTYCRGGIVSAQAVATGVRSLVNSVFLLSCFCFHLLPRDLPSCISLRAQHTLTAKRSSVIISERRICDVASKRKISTSMILFLV